MNKNTYRGDKPKSVGRHNKYKRENNDSAYHINKLDNSNSNKDTDEKNLQNQNKSFNRSDSKGDTPNQSDDRKAKRNATQKKQNSYRFDKDRVKSVPSGGSSNKRGDTTQSRKDKFSKRNAADTSPPVRAKVNRGFLDKKAERQKHKTEKRAEFNNSDNKNQISQPYLRNNRHAGRQKPAIYGALDLGTNNCRLLLAKPQRRGFRVVDSFSRIIRLGEGLGNGNRLSDEAMDRTIDALKICSEKMAYRGVHKSRLIATEASRRAVNGAEFIHRVHAETGLKLEIIDQETEAKLAVAGCAALLDDKSDYALVFDIGGGSSELILVEISPKSASTDGHQIENSPYHPSYRIIDWVSLPVGVVTLSEKFGGRDVTHDIMAQMMDHVDVLLSPFEEKHQITQKITNEKFHLLGTSGTVTTVAGIHLKLEQYDRRRIDGFWLESALSIGVTNMLIDMKYEGRSNHPCIGAERADLVLAGCAIFNAIYKKWPAERTRVADRGLREGILTNLMSKDLRNDNDYRNV